MEIQGFGLWFPERAFRRSGVQGIKVDHSSGSLMSEGGCVLFFWGGLVMMANQESGREEVVSEECSEGSVRPRLKHSTNPLIWLTAAGKRRIFHTEEEKPERVPLNAWLAILSGIAMVLCIQIPVGIFATFASPTLDTEIIVGCACALLVVKVLGVSFDFPWNQSLIVILALLANILIGLIAGECIHFVMDVVQQHLPFSEVLLVVIALTVFGFVVWCMAAELRHVMSYAKTYSNGEEVWWAWAISSASYWWVAHLFVAACIWLDHLVTSRFISHESTSETDKFA